MLPCKEIVRILSSHEKQSWMRRAELRMHLFMCEHCSRFAAHLELIRSGFKKLFTHITRVEPEEVKKLEDDVIEKIQKHG